VSIQAVRITGISREPAFRRRGSKVRKRCFVREPRPSRFRGRSKAPRHRSTIVYSRESPWQP